MAHMGKDDRWEAKVAFAAPNDVTLTLPGEKTFSRKVDDSYDPNKGVPAATVHSP